MSKGIASEARWVRDSNPSGPQASCPSVLQSLSSCWCEPQVDPWEAVAAAVWGLVSHCVLSRGETLAQLSPRHGWLHFTGHSANLEMMAVTSTVPCIYGSGWADVHPWTSHWSMAGGIGPVAPILGAEGEVDGMPISLERGRKALGKPAGSVSPAVQVWQVSAAPGRTE